MGGGALAGRVDDERQVESEQDPIRRQERESERARLGDEQPVERIVATEGGRQRPDSLRLLRADGEHGQALSRQSVDEILRQIEPPSMCLIDNSHTDVADTWTAAASAIPPRASRPGLG
ncbi:hypothetical protein Acsp07_46750 [Actinomycetospora sp. NBRC 106378]|nr:hypothetical protein Acsp07_46750 [Actinomycetospora sp. NBRC 106378]